MKYLSILGTGVEVRAGFNRVGDKELASPKEERVEPRRPTTWDFAFEEFRPGCGNTVRRWALRVHWGMAVPASFGREEAN